MQHTFYSLLCLLLLSACGGGGGESASAPDPVVTPGPTQPAPEPETLFNEDPTLLIDAVSYYSEACIDPSVQFVIPVHLNDDKRADFIAHFWCDSDNPSAYDDTPTEDMLVAYISDGFGGYNIDNYNVFGDVSAKLGGASRKYALGDINGDGTTDIAFAMNAEDGRQADGATETNYAVPALLLSNNMEGYDIVHLGEADWGHSVRIKDSTVLFAGHRPQAFTYNYPGEWVDVTSKYNTLSYASFLTYDDYVVNSVRNYVYDDDGNATGSQGLELVEDNVVVSSIMYDEVFTIKSIGWNDANNPDAQYNDLGVYNIRGRNVIHGMTTEMCRMDDMIVATINAAELREGELTPGNQYTDLDFDPVIFFAFYTVDNGELVELSITIEGEEPNNNFNFHDCDDVTGDGNKDIVAQAFGPTGVPLVYVAEGNSFYKLDTTDWPVYSSYETSAQGFMYDVDNSGTADLVLYPTKVAQGAEVQIYLTNMSIADKE